MDDEEALAFCRQRKQHTMAPFLRHHASDDLLEATQQAVFATELGWFAAAATDDCLLSVVFAHRSAAAARAAVLRQTAGGIEREIEREHLGN
jgi:hypothetical protein